MKFLNDTFFARTAGIERGAATEESRPVCLSANETSDYVGFLPATCGASADMVGSSPATCGASADMVGSSPATCGASADIVGSSLATCGASADIVGSSLATCGGQMRRAFGNRECFAGNGLSHTLIKF
ncbi:MAG: hypothetical protein LBP64_10295 [Tannerella sp.]|jgi:hypothetical protein|nr:hypothetical protein [Tannerella sp.]